MGDRVMSGGPVSRVGQADGRVVEVESRSGTRHLITAGRVRVVDEQGEMVVTVGIPL